MMCIKSVSYSVLLNGEPKGLIRPTRGIRQGDPISPYLFLLCGEGLSAMLKQAENRGSINGVSVCRKAPRISQLLFADDCLVFCKANMKECSNIWKILQDYEMASGQKMNRDKTSLFFSKNMHTETQDSIKELFGAQVIKQHEQYLGLPSLVGRGKKKAFNKIKDQMGRRIAGWKGKLLSSAGRETLIKAVAQATPTYSMSCFKISDSLCKELGAMICWFWWGQKKEERKIPWIAWDKLCKPKADGGMGFKDLKAFNLALLAKQGWRLLHNQNTLFHQVFKAKYFENSTFLEAELGKHPSFAWRSIMATKNVVAEGTRWSIGKGNKIRLWEDKWLPTPTHFKPVSPRKNLQEGNQVSSLIDQNLHAWREDVVRNTFLPHEAEIILGIPLSSFPIEDRRVWSAIANGVFSVRSAYQVAQRLQESKDIGNCSDSSVMAGLWKTIWNLKCPCKLRNFAWRASKNILPTKTRLRDRHVQVDVECDMCEAVETPGHVFWGCGLAMEEPKDFCDLLWLFKERLQNADLEVLIAATWGIWNNRNDVRHGGPSKIATVIVTNAYRYMKEFRQATVTTVPRRESVQERWKPPPHRWYKINIDGATFKDEGHCGLGIIVRNDKGEIMGALSKRIRFPLGALEAEAKAAECGLIFAWELGLREVIIEGDSHVVIHALSTEQLAPLSIQQLISGTKTWLPNFRAWKARFARRDCNKAAHLMARHAKKIEDCIIWVEDTPPFIVSEVHYDVFSLGSIQV
ncbi:hypothetical protein SO802_010364 [Lithocarpus litseifolius]|uniref:Reverse transcriptase domain-containing protein n=1 Tax=Lithocarpus litseifolius TaxID=425828 RepID=A0AAW2DEJ2_9ROSI